MRRGRAAPSPSLSLTQELPGPVQTRSATWGHRVLKEWLLQLGNSHLRIVSPRDLEARVFIHQAFLHWLRLSLALSVSPMFLWPEKSLKQRDPELEVRNGGSRASLVAQWLRICLLMQGTRVQALVWEDPTCRGATGPVSHNY